MDINRSSLPPNLNDQLLVIKETDCWNDICSTYCWDYNRLTTGCRLGTDCPKKHEHNADLMNFLLDDSVVLIEPDSNDIDPNTNYVLCLRHSDDISDDIPLSNIEIEDDDAKNDELPPNEINTLAPNTFNGLYGTNYI